MIKNRSVNTLILFFVAILGAGYVNAEQMDHSSMGSHHAGTQVQSKMENQKKGENNISNKHTDMEKHHAEQMEHAMKSKQHGSAHMPDKTPEGLSVLKAIPGSGKAREAGYDGVYIMEANSVEDNAKALCAKASRGLIMVDRATRSQCGGSAMAESSHGGKSGH